MLVTSSAAAVQVLKLPGFGNMLAVLTIQPSSM